MKQNETREYAILPIAMQLCLDDVGWHRGDDERSIQKPSRTGIPRMHAPEDYIVANEIGKAIDMKILCALCLGEWDKDNLLKDEVGITYDPFGWNRAAEIDYDMAEKYKQAAESSEYLEYCVHGLLHGNYDANGGQLRETEYFAPEKRGEAASPLPISEVKHRLDLFEKIYRSWGFQKKFRAICSPGGVPPEAMGKENSDAFSQEFASRGLFYALGMTRDNLDGGYLDNQVYWLQHYTDVEPPWNAFDLDPALLDDCTTAREQKKTIWVWHWVNFQRYNPKRNLEYLEDWAAYFKRQAEIFGLMLSKDIAFAANQLLYVQHAKLEQNDDTCTIDLAEVLKQDMPKRRNEFYISLKNGIRPTGCVGGTVEVYEAHKDFTNYKITHTDDKVTITLER